MTTKRYALTIPSDVHRELRVFCVEHEETMNTVIVEAITKYLTETPKAVTPEQ